ncbi:MAG: amino acid permease [Candidatus Aureabacteria bacterium]|nr:amino acid permease [Candidatus Auribacterota bacterium]
MKRFSTFEGVFLPTFLSILGVIMYLRLGWVVGQTGLKGALLIIILSNVITLLTGLSISSIATNMRLGAGGAYTIISKSLGYQIGGAIGIPLYISQAVSVAFYITGFTECWVSVFPLHNFLVVSIVLWLLLLTVSYMSAKFAFKLQYGILIIIVLSLVSAFLGKSSIEAATFFGEGIGNIKFWQVFAVFFPAVTGILAGVSMSGELEKPSKNIPVGTLSAIGLGLIVYIFLAIWFSTHATSQQLISNSTIIADLARWRFLVVAGIMGATLSSALSMFVASPRTLLALGKHRIIPFSTFFSKVNSKGEPAKAILLTAVLCLVTIFLGSLNKIAVLLTMFFLITYGMLNIAVFIEQGIGILSFRPSFKVPLFFSLLGGIGCIATMFLINPVFSVIAIAVIIVIYMILIHKEVQRSWPDVRKGLFIFIAEKALKVASELPYHPKTWKPNLLIPIRIPKDWIGMTEFIKNIVFPNGRVTLLSIAEDTRIPQTRDEKLKLKKKTEQGLDMLKSALQEDNILVTPMLVESHDFLEGTRTVTQALKDSFLPPNILFLKLGFDCSRDHIIESLFQKEKKEDIGIMVFEFHPTVGLGEQKTVNLWVRDKSPNLNLAVLTALQIKQNWDGNLRIIQVVGAEEEKERATQYLEKLRKLTRIPRDTIKTVMVGDFKEVLASAPPADINIFGVAENLDTSWIRNITETVNTSVLFLRDAKDHSALA